MSQTWLDAIETLGRFGSSELAGVGIPALLVVLGVSLASSLFISYLYVVFFQSRATGSGLHRAFPLIAVSVTAIFVSVQFSLPLSLGLLGALSFVRFRMPVKEPEEIGFLLLVIATSLAAATFNMVFLSIVLVVATLAALLLQVASMMQRDQPSSGTVVCTLRTPESRAKLEDLRRFLKKSLPAGRIDSLAESEESTTLHYSFTKLHENRLAELNDGVAGVAAGIESVVYFNRPESI